MDVFFGLFGRFANTRAKRITLLLLFACIAFRQRIRQLYESYLYSPKIHAQICASCRQKNALTIEEKHYELKEELSHEYMYPNQPSKGIPITQDILTISSCEYTPINGLFKCILSNSKWSNNGNICLENAVSVQIVYDRFKKHKNIYNSEWDKSVKRCWILSDINRTIIYYAAPQLNDEYLPNDNHWICVNGTSPTPQISIAIDKIIRSTNQQLTVQNKQLIEKNSELESKNRQLIAQNEELTNQEHKIEELVSKNEELLNKYKNKIDVLSEQNKELIIQNEELLSKNNELSEENIEHGALLINCNSINEKLDKFVNKPDEYKVHSNDEQHARLEEQRILLEREREKRYDELLLKQKKDIQEQQNLLTKLKTEQQQELQHKMDTFDTQKQELQSLQFKLAQERISIEQNRKQYEIEIKDMRNKNENEQKAKTIELQQQKQELNTQIQTLKNLQKQMKNEKLTLQKQREYDQKIFFDQREKLQKETQQLIDKNKAELETEKLRQQAQLNRDKNDYLKISDNKMKELEDKIRAKTDENNTNIDLIGDLKKKIREFEEHEAAIMNAYMNNTVDNEELKKDNEILKKQNTELNILNESSETLNESLNNEEESLNNESLNESLSEQGFKSLSDIHDIKYAHWKNDKGVKSCFMCKLNFNKVYRRKHHCRSCGQIFCKECSKNKMILEQYGHTEPVRVCDECYLNNIIGVRNERNEPSLRKNSKSNDGNNNSTQLSIDI